MEGVTVVQVTDTRAALVGWMGLQLGRHRPRVLAVTGSVGKTTATKLIRSALSACGIRCFDNDNRNDLFGLPIALGELSSEYEYAVLELACVERGEFPKLLRTVQPSVLVTTGFGAARLENFGSPEAVAAEVREGLTGCELECFIFNGDDPLASSLAKRGWSQMLSYGISDRAEIRARDILATLEGTEFVVEWGSWSCRVRLKLLGTPAVYGALAALATVAAEDPDSLSAAVAALAEVEPLPGRLKPLRGISGSTIVDDSFNSSLPSLEALMELGRVLPGRKVFVLGDTSGLGKFRDLYAQRVGEGLAQIADRAVLVGRQADLLRRKAEASGCRPDIITVAPTVREAAVLLGRLGEGDVVLVKGSEEARMERVTARILEPSEAAVKVLPRQDAGWASTVSYSRERPTWLEIDLGAIASNLQLIRRAAGRSVDIMAILKADAYGHGAVQVARTVALHGVHMVGVATVNEGILLREQGIRLPILVLGYVPPWQVRDAIANDLGMALFSERVARYADRWARAMGKVARVHVKVDTGMSRLGLPPEDVPDFLETVMGLAAVRVEGIFTHFANADDPDHPMNHEQVVRFRRVLELLKGKGWVPKYVHAANSAAIFYLPDSHFNIVRPGIALYGLRPSLKVEPPEGLRPALSFKSHVAQVKQLRKGTCVSYGCRYVTERDSVIAVLPVGYGDGFRRGPRGWKEVLVRGQRAPVVGTVCMDMCMVDVTDVPAVREGDEVVLIGEQGHQRITVEEVAGWLGTVSYEVVSEILARVPRVPV
jgi:alanine racemase